MLYSPAKNRCVYVYYRHAQNTEGEPTAYPYYVGKGTIRRAYDWVRHTNVTCPERAEDIHILGKNMCDVDAQQAEILLIYLYGRKMPARRETIRPTWSSSSYRTDIVGTLVNKSIGGDGPASNDPRGIEIADHNEKEFWRNNPCFCIITHPDGYWYSPQYPTIKSTHGQWIHKQSRGLGIIREKSKHKNKAAKLAPRGKSIPVPKTSEDTFYELVGYGLYPPRYEYSWSKDE